MLFLVDMTLTNCSKMACHNYDYIAYCQHKIYRLDLPSGNSNQISHCKEGTIDETID